MQSVAIRPLRMPYNGEDGSDLRNLVVDGRDNDRFRGWKGEDRKRDPDRSFHGN